MLSLSMIASSGLVSQIMPQPQCMRAAAPQMFFAGDVTADPRVNFKGKKVVGKKPPVGGKKAPAFKKSVPRAAISKKKTGPTFIDVTGKSYNEVNTFVPQYDEIGVLPPLGRWDPLQIREQGPARYRRFVEMEIKHGRLAMAAFLGVITT